MENDATACFDRMIPSLVMMLALRANGVPSAITQIVGNTLANMRYKIKTKLGISNRHYSHTAANPIYGTGQGVPARWRSGSSSVLSSSKSCRN